MQTPMDPLQVRRHDQALRRLAREVEEALMMCRGPLRGKGAVYTCEARGSRGGRGRNSGAGHTP